MEYDRLLADLDDDARQKEEIALAIYYLDRFEEEDSVTQSDVKSVLKRSRSSVSSSNVSTYFVRLSDDRWIKSIGQGRYRLTRDGKDGVEDILDEDAIDNPRDEDDFFIDFDDFENDHRYQQLVEDINESYRYRIYDATMVLTRKLFEDMVYQILKAEYAGRKENMHFDHEHGWHFGFDDLLSNLRTAVPELREYCRDLNQPLVDDIRDFKNEADDGAHLIRVDFTDEDVEDRSDEATLMTEVLYETLIYARRNDQSNS